MQHVRIAFSLFIWLLLIGCFGCSTLQHSTHIQKELPELTDTKILSIALNDGKMIAFDSEGGRFIPNSVSDTLGTVVGMQYDGTPISMPSQNIREIRVEKERTDVGEIVVGTGLSVGGAVAAAMIFLVIAFSNIR